MICGCEHCKHQTKEHGGHRTNIDRREPGERFENHDDRRFGALSIIDRVLKHIASASDGHDLTFLQKRAIDRELANRAALCARIGLDPNKTFG